MAKEVVIGEAVEKISHSCGSRNGLQVFEKEDGKINGYCFSCDTYVPHPYGDEPAAPRRAVFRKSKEEIQGEIKEVASYTACDLPERELRKDSLDYFGVKIGVSEQDGETPTLHYYPYYKDGELTAYKVRLIENKKMWSIGDQKEVDLFGWEQAKASGAKRLLITEGECDAVALYQILTDSNKNTTWADYKPAVVSIPHGSGTADRDIGRMLTEIRRHFKEVVLVFDSDEAGKSALERVSVIAPDFMVADLPAKDANACLLEGRSRACKTAVMFKADKPKNTRLVYGSSLSDAARQEAEWGLSYPWDGLTDLTRGMRFGEVYYWGAGVKMGKSELVNALGSHIILEHKLPIFMAKPEESNRKTYQMLVGKAANRIFHDPKIPFDYAAYDKAEPAIGDKVVMVDLYQHLGWSTLKGDITACALEGYKVVFIDPITNLTNNMDSGEANTALTAIAAELSAMALDLGLSIHIFCHLKAPTNGEPHEQGGKVYSNQFAGSRAMMRSANYMIGIEGNKDDQLPIEERNIRELVILEDREFGNVGRVKLYWDYKTGAFNQM